MHFAKRSRRPAHDRRGYSLFSMMLLVALVAVLFASASTAEPSEPIPVDATVSLGIVGGLGMGIYTGVTRPAQRLRGVLIGVLVGSATGGWAGLIAASRYRVEMLLAASLLLVACAYLARFTRRDAEADELPDRFDRRADHQSR